MVLGLKAKTRKSPSVQVDYLIHIQEIKPWPPSQLLRTLRGVLIQWEHGDRSSGSTNQVIPSLGAGSGVGDGRIEFNESFMLPVTLLRELSIKGGNGDTYQKNCIEFNLYEPRRDKTVKKGQLLGTAVLDLADYGVVKETLIISAPINCKRTYRNTSQPLLFLKIQSVEKSRMSSSSGDCLTRESSTYRNGVDSVSALMNEEYAEEVETASFTDDDVSSHSSLVVSSSALESNGGSPPQNKEDGLEGMKASFGQAEDVCIPALEQQLAKADDKQLTTSNVSMKGDSSCSSSVDLTSDLAWITKRIGARSVQSSSSPVLQEVTEKEKYNLRSTSAFDEVPCDIGERVLDGGSSDTTSTIEQSSEANISNPLKREAFPDSEVNGDEILGSINSFDSFINGGIDDTAAVPNNKGIYKADLPQNGCAESGNCEIYQENVMQRKIMEGMGQFMEDEPMDSFSQDDSRDHDSFESDTLLPSREHLALKSSHQNTDRYNKQVKSVRSSMDPNRSNGSVQVNQFILGDRQNGAQGFMSDEGRDSKVHPKETRNIISDSKIKQLEQRIKRLEAELRETAATEVGLYSVVAEHGSSTNKVHAPARRLSRFYLHASKVNSQSQRGSAAKSSISGLILVAKASGNDVPRLTFWLSNSIVLRAIISESLGEQQLPLSGPVNGKNGVRNGNKKSSLLKWESLSSKGIKNTLDGCFDNWEDPCTFMSALEKVESWIFSRIIESIWWQTLIPHMQSGAIQRGIFLNSHKIYQRTSSSGDEGTFSLELWKKAFRDACERICPVRAEGHECGCLPILSRLIMEQCVARLDVAMFNAILRDTVDDIPTDPVSDPICDATILPVPVGKASFRAGAQLKNAIGNWSRCLTDLFGIDDDDALEDVNSACETSDDEGKEQDTSLKPFSLLNGLSDLMMLPKDMLLSRTVRKEICPTFGPTLTRRVLNAFVPDEFCPEPVPKVVLEALYSEDSFDEEEDYVNFPCSAAPIVYRPPSAISVAGIIGDAGNHYRLTRKGSLVLTKSYTSDDELDELASPLSSIIIDGVQGSSSTKTIWTSWGDGSQNAMRYQLLHDVWKNIEW